MKRLDIRMQKLLPFENFFSGMKYQVYRFQSWCLSEYSHPPLTQLPQCFSFVIVFHCYIYKTLTRYILYHSPCEEQLRKIREAIEIEMHPNNMNREVTPGSLFYTHSKKNGTTIQYTITRPHPDTCLLYLPPPHLLTHSEPPTT